MTKSTHPVDLQEVIDALNEKGQTMHVLRDVENKVRAVFSRTSENSRTAWLDLENTVIWLGSREVAALVDWLDGTMVAEDRMQREADKS